MRHHKANEGSEEVEEEDQHRIAAREEAWRGHPWRTRGLRLPSWRPLALLLQDQEDEDSHFGSLRCVATREDFFIFYFSR